MARRLVLIILLTYTHAHSYLPETKQRQRRRKQTLFMTLRSCVTALWCRSRQQNSRTREGRRTSTAAMNTAVAHTPTVWSPLETTYASTTTATVRANVSSCSPPKQRTPEEKHEWRHVRTQARRREGGREAVSEGVREGKTDGQQQVDSRNRQWCSASGESQRGQQVNGPQQARLANVTDRARVESETVSSSLV